jgi:translation initiation factor 3 subunit E
MSSYDLTSRLAAYMDRHLILPMLEFLLEANIQAPEEVQEARLQILQKTYMLDSYKTLYKDVKGTDAPAEIMAKRKEIVERIRGYQSEVGVFIKAFLSTSEGSQEQLWKQLRDQGNFNLEYLQRNYNITEGTLESMYKYAKSQYEVGQYQCAAEFLYFYRLLSAAREHDASAMWGKLAAEILVHQWAAAVDDLRLLREALDSTHTTPVMSRVWLMHWALFIFSHHNEGMDIMQEFFFEERGGNDVRGTHYLQALQTAAPHMLRYLTAACVINRKKKPRLMKELERLVEQEAPTYRDPITEFVEQLCLNCDFEAAQEKLKQCEDVLANDFFLANHKNQFLENARLLLFENYCRIHCVIDIGMVAEKLNMDHEKAEIWIVNLIRQARLEARIDSQNNQVIMDMHAPDVYQTVKEKTKSLPGRTAYLWRNANAPKGTTPTPE